MAGIWDFLQRKYDIMQQQADADTMRANADANLNNVKAGLLPADAKAGIGLTEAQTRVAGVNAGFIGANTDQVREQTKTIVPLADANIAESRSRGRLYGSQATGEDQLNRFSKFRFRGLGDDYGKLDDFVRSSMRYGMGPFAGE